MLPDCSGFTCGCWSTVSSSRWHSHAAFRWPLVDLRLRFVRLPSSLGIPNIAPPSSHLVRSTPATKTVSRLRGFGEAMPMTPHVPSSPFLTTSTAFSRSKPAGLLHPASDPGVRPVSGDFIPRPAPHHPSSAFQLSDGPVSLHHPRSSRSGALPLVCPRPHGRHHPSKLSPSTQSPARSLAMLPLHRSGDPSARLSR